MKNTTYNGWTNYATWRINLEMFDGVDLACMGWQKLDSYDLGRALKDYAEEMIEETSTAGLARDYALAFLSDVNWRELAEHYICDYENDERDETEEEA
jgi:hypothetical protein